MQHLSVVDLAFLSRKPCLKRYWCLACSTAWPFVLNHLSHHIWPRTQRLNPPKTWRTLLPKTVEQNFTWVILNSIWDTHRLSIKMPRQFDLNTFSTTIGASFIYVSFMYPLCISLSWVIYYCIKKHRVRDLASPQSQAKHIAWQPLQCWAYAMHGFTTAQRFTLSLGGTTNTRIHMVKIELCTR